MVCSNCQSKELIRVQNEYFCTNCGHTMADPVVTVAKELDKTGLPEGVQIIADTTSSQPPVVDKIEGEPALVTEDLAAPVDLAPTPTPLVTESSIEAKPSLIVNHTAPQLPSQPEVAAPAEKPKKRRVGRPKAPRLDVPVAAAVVAASVEPKTVDAPKIQAASKAKPTAHSKNTSMSDLRPTSSGAAQVDVLAGVIAEGAHKPQSKQQSIRTGDVLAESWQGRFMPHHSLFALVPAAIIALISGGVAAAMLGSKSGELIQVTKAAAIPVLGDLVIILMLYYVCRSLATAAITFAAARSADHRKAPMNRWWGVAINSFGGKLRFDLVMFVAEIGVVALIVGLLMVGGTAWPVPEYIQIVAIFAAFLALLYALSGLALTQGFGRVSVVLGTTKPRQAFGVGWGFFRGHFDLVGAKILSLILELLIVVPLVIAVIVVGYTTSSSSDWWFILALTLAVALGGALIGAGTAIWWESAYRHLVRNERISEAVSLLTGRMAEKAHRLPLILVTMLITTLVVTATVWPWLPWPSL